MDTKLSTNLFLILTILLFLPALPFVAEILSLKRY
jgi:hypothetical protein